MNLIFGKIQFPEIWAKILSANKVVGFLNQLYLENKIIENSEFVHLVTNSLKLIVDWKILGWTWS